MIDRIDKKIISIIQSDIPLDLKPFAVMARQIGLTEQEFLDRVKALKKQGIMRRFGATLRHQEAGYSSNAMIAWNVHPDKIDTIGETLGKFREVSHCYHRMPQKDWHYNLFTMVHGGNHETCCRIAEKMSQVVSIGDYILLFSEKEFKKTSMEYFYNE